VHAATSLSSVPNQYAAYDAMGNMTCRNTDLTTGHTCAGSTPTGAVMSDDSWGQLAAWNAPSGTVGSTHYLYDNQGNRVLTNASNASSTTDTISFDGYTDMVITGGTSTTTTYYSANGTRRYAGRHPWWSARRSRRRIRRQRPPRSRRCSRSSSTTTVI
jgi:hypothetical protein